MSKTTRSVIRPNATVLIIVILAAIVGLVWYVVKMYHLEVRLQEMLEQQQQLRSASPAPESAPVTESL